MNQYDAIQNLPCVEPHQEENSPVWDTPKIEEIDLEWIMNDLYTKHCHGEKAEFEITVIEPVEGNSGCFEFATKARKDIAILIDSQCILIGYNEHYIKPASFYYSDLYNIHALKALLHLAA